MICVKSVLDTTIEEDALAESCSGDSEPLHYFNENEQRYQQVGLVSFTESGCSFSTQNSAYTKVSHYNEWLNSIITYGEQLIYDPTLEDGNTHSTGVSGTFNIDDYYYDYYDNSSSSSSGGSTSILSLLFLGLIAIRRKMFTS